MENESYGHRLEKKLDSIQNKLDGLSENSVRTNVVMDSLQELSKENSRLMALFEQRLSSVESKQTAQDSGINVIKYIIGGCSGIVLAACIWVGSSIIQTNQDQSIIKEKVARLEGYHK